MSASRAMCTTRETSIAWELSLRVRCAGSRSQRRVGSEVTSDSCRERCLASLAMSSGANRRWGDRVIHVGGSLHSSFALGSNLELLFLHFLRQEEVQPGTD